MNLGRFGRAAEALWRAAEPPVRWAAEEVTSDEVEQAVSAQIEPGLSFEKLHGLTAQNLRSLLLEPYEVVVDPDDLETNPRAMWVVLHERRQAREGYVVVFDPYDATWGVAEFTEEPVLTLIVSAPSLAEALSGM